MWDEPPRLELTHSNLIRAIAEQEKLISNYERARERILERRRSATVDVMVALDARLAQNQRMIDSSRHAVAISLRAFSSLQAQCSQGEAEAP